MPSLRLQQLRPRLLEPVSLTLAAGALGFVSGPSGAGKSLLLRAIADLDPNDGEVFLGDQARSSVAAPDWRRRVGLLPAESGWWAETVAPHFARRSAGAERTHGPVDEDARHRQRPRQQDQELDALLRRFGFEADVLDWTVLRLSTGERQRLALARLLWLHPQALLLDEATANLDPANRSAVEAVVEDYRRRRGAAVLWASHDPEQRARLGDVAWVIREHRLVPEEGP
ncbi:ATP-binding cassette domain-containing protein [Thiohalocapsa marina]|uniref:ATP-binding cassette domain-containing protein n=1 Tax=Thiohalocapsa marina TaxID=424902 RepID=A0A5M8FN83_9GAMM|nr:ATP-binding cassette domain-containing protein [Thiohalocapsa marina]KAA6185166.1 ATP-binding cassette domain-containing protein [Thiohalocapsa marina]